MTLPSFLPSLLRSAGLEVVVVDGWLGRHRPGAFAPVGVLNHHTGASAKGWSRAKELSYAKWMFLNGRSDLNPPLVQIALGRSGVVYLGAAGRANHAGRAKASGSVAAGDGNALYVGIEWMLSGTEAIPANMMGPGITLNAVLTEKVLRTSTRAISCHYQTSVTGKWDIGDPNGVPFGGHRVLDVPKFRTAVAAERQRLYASTPPVHPKPHHDIYMGQCSMQFSDTPAQWRFDLERMFSRRRRWYTGTEGGETDNWSVVQSVAKKYGYSVWRYKSNWVAIKKAVIKRGSVKVGTKIVADTSVVAGPGWDTSFLWVEFDDVFLKRRVAVISTHGPTKGDPHAKDPARRVNLRWTRRLGEMVSRKAAELGKGVEIVFAGGDSNIDDRFSDIFFGGPMTSCWDELKKYPGTLGTRTIDFIASYDGDGMVKCLSAHSFSDKELFLYTDHNYVEAVYRIEDLP